MIGGDVNGSLALGEFQQKWWLHGNIGQSKVGVLREVSLDSDSIFVTYSVGENAKNNCALLRVGVNSRQLDDVLSLGTGAKSAGLEDDLFILVVSALELESCATFKKMIKKGSSLK